MGFAGPSVTYHFPKTTPGMNQAAAIYKGFERQSMKYTRCLKVYGREIVEDNQMEKFIFQLRTEMMGGAVRKGQRMDKSGEPL